MEVFILKQGTNYPVTDPGIQRLSGGAQRTRRSKRQRQYGNLLCLRQKTREFFQLRSAAQSEQFLGRCCIHDGAGQEETDHQAFF